MTTRLVGYVRCSTGEQALSGLGLAAQEARICETIAREGWELVGVATDAGEHGTNLQRPGLRSALNTIAVGGADGLIASKLDRVSRSVIDFATLLAWFAESRASLVILDPAIDTSTPSGRLVANVFASVAEWEADTIALRTVDALAAKRARGEAISRPSVVDDQALAEHIRGLRHQGLTLRGIADRLNAESVPTLRGAASWKLSAVQSALGYKRPPARRQNADLPTPRGRRKTRNVA